MTRIAFATCEKVPRIWEDDARALGPLEARGVRAEAAVWSDPSVEWGSFDAVILRSCWDYHERLPAFVEWLARLERACPRVLNAPSLVRWNLRKTYLRDLEARGVPVVPTRYVEPRGIEALLAAIEGAPWEEVVVKPAVSAGAFRTHRLTRAGARARAADLAPLGESGDTALVQPFMREIVEEGEWSLIHLGGALSHSVLKRPGQGDFRVQQHLGGSTRAEAPPPEVRDAARRVMAALEGEAPLYARVDLVRHDGAVRLVELEAIEPLLFLGYDEAAPERFAEAIARAVGPQK